MSLALASTSTASIQYFSGTEIPRKELAEFLKLTHYHCAPFLDCMIAKIDGIVGVVMFGPTEGDSSSMTLKHIEVTKDFRKERDCYRTNAKNDRKNERIRKSKVTNRNSIIERGEFESHRRIY
jgi:hypothetical protein